MAKNYNEEALIEALFNDVKDDFDHVDQGSFEWNFMWNSLWSLTSSVTYTKEGLAIQDLAEFNPKYNEVWQYMGSQKGYTAQSAFNEMQSQMPVTARNTYNAQNLWLEIVEPKNWWMHSFRHRMHPKTHKREYVYLPASKAFMYFKTNNIPFRMGEVEPIDLS